MRYAADIQLQELVVHILDPWHPNGLVLSETTCPLTDNRLLVEYFTSHIENSLGDKATKAAKFKEIATETTAGMCQGVLDGSLDLVEGSRQLAERLYNIMARNRVIKAGDLAVCLFRAGNRPEIPRYLALLKLDPSAVLRHVTERDAQGNLFVNFEVQQDVLPTTRERLQKCAFVQPLDPRPDYDMMLLDWQVGRREERAVAKFFAEDFLNCEMALDARQRTRRLYVGALSAYNAIRPQLDPDEEDALRQSIDTVVRAESVDVDQWLSGLPLAEEHKAKIDQTVSERLPDRAFDIDRDYARRLVEKRRFRGDFDLQVDVRADRYEQVIKKAEWCQELGYYEIVIHTRRWREVI